MTLPVNPDPPSSSSKAADEEKKALGKKEAHPSITLAGQMWPEDAFVAWQKEHPHGDNECPDDDSEHCAFMSGIAYAEEVMLTKAKAADLGKPEAKDSQRLDWLDKQGGDIDVIHHDDLTGAETNSFTLCFHYPALSDDGSESLRDAIDAAMGTSAHNASLGKPEAEKASEEKEAVADGVKATGQKYRKRPVIITAQQFLEGEPIPKGVCFGWRCGGDPSEPHVHTIHDNQRVDVVFGDWIVPEPDGEHYYPVRDDIFWRTYERVDNSVQDSNVAGALPVSKDSSSHPNVAGAEKVTKEQQAETATQRIENLMIELYGHALGRANNARDSVKHFITLAIEDSSLSLLSDSVGKEKEDSGTQEAR